MTPPRFTPLLTLALLAFLPTFARADTTGLGRHKQLYAVPAPGQIQIDGDLNDWDLSGQIQMFVLSEGIDTQSAKFALMYDDQNLYLGGIVRDPSPMMNRQDPLVNGDRGWDADSCQFRLTLDPTKPYPETETVWPYNADAKLEDKRDDIKHLTLWNYTDRNEAALQMQMGMKFRNPRANWIKGVVPADLFRAKYRKDKDGKGYSFEYAIPWKTLDAKAPLKGGNIVAGTVQFNWGTPDGLKTGGGGAWAYDVMARPGFVFQDATVWGKIIFAETGNVDKKLVEAGVPQEKPQPLKFAYDLPRDGQITLQIVDENRMVRRVLLAQADRTKGRHEEAWDGMDDQGQPLTAGQYTVKGIVHDPIRGEFVLSVHNAGNPPYPTDDGKGGWGGDHGSPTAVTALPGGMLLGWDGAEYGWGIIRVDLQGRKQWGIKTGALFLANDGQRFFAYDPHGFQASNGIAAFDVADGRPLNFGNGKPLLQAPAGGTKETDEATGLAWANGKIYVSYAARDLIAVFDAASGDLQTTWKIAKPGVLAARPDGVVVAISDQYLVTLKDGKAAILQTKIEDATGISIASDGRIFVSTQGVTQNIAVFDGKGKPLRSIGKSGGRPALGQYDKNGLYQPNGLALDSQNNLWVAEHADYPKRISVWDAQTGRFAREFFGGSAYFGYAAIDPKKPTEIYAHNVIWRVDWDKKTTTPLSTIWRKTAPDMMGEPDPSAYPQGFRPFTASDGKQYGFGLDRSIRRSVLYRRQGAIYQPFLATFQLDHQEKWGVAAIDDPKQTPAGWYLWQDVNADARLQRDELSRFDVENQRFSIHDVAPDMTLWLSDGYKLAPTSHGAQGQPIYDGAKLQKSFLVGTPYGKQYLWLGPDNSVYTNNPGQRPSLAKWNADGKMEWGYPGIVDWHDALGLPVVKAGRLHGLTGPLGVAGDFTGNMSYFGVVHLFQKDGLYTAAIFRDGRTSGGGPDIGQPEGQGGQMVQIQTKPGAKPRTFVLAGGQDSRVTEVLGLDTIQALPDQTLILSDEQIQLAATALAGYNAALGKNSQLAIADGRKWLETSPPVEKALDGARSFAARAARDGKNLYFQFDVNAPNELVNSATDPKLVFKGGNALDIQIGTDKNADPARKTPAPGDVRLLVTRQIVDGQPRTLAVLYRPKVANFAGEPIVLQSPTGRESFDEISVVEVELQYRKTANGFVATIAVPLETLGWTPQKGESVRMDVGYLFGNATGNLVAARSYWSNNGFSANVTNDIPNESRLEPAQWGVAMVE